MTVAADRGWLRAVDLRRPKKSRRPPRGCQIGGFVEHAGTQVVPVRQSIFRRYQYSPDRYGKWCDTRVKSLCFGCD